MGYGKLVLFGSGEAGPTGRAIHRKVLRTLPERQSVAILETPAGFQPNSRLVAEEIAETFEESLGEFVGRIDVIPARKKGTRYSPDNEEILKPLERATFIFLGPGSPTYAVKQLRETAALRMLLNRWKKGATVSMASAAALAAGERTLPVYEIYKVGADLFWDEGLNFLKLVGLDLTVVTHWNNNEGGEKLDTSRCYMGEERFARLRRLLPRKHKILGIDEHTAAIFHFNREVFKVEGRGNVYLLAGKKKATFNVDTYYEIASLKTGRAIRSKLKDKDFVIRKREFRQKRVEKEELSERLQRLLSEREKAREKENFARADEIRKLFVKEGYEIRDTELGQKVYKN